MEKHEFGNKDASLVLVQLVDQHMLEEVEKEAEIIKDLTGKDFALHAIKVNNWNNNLSPWPAPAVFGKEDFGGQAESTLSEVINYCQDSSKTYYIGGYSLAALFALWSAYNTDLFKGIAAASPSMWFPGFDAYMNDNDIKAKKVYLSLGDKEERTKNPVMATVGDKIRDAYNLLDEKGVDVILEWNEGNHFKDATLRTAKAFAWLLNNNNF